MKKSRFLLIALALSIITCIPRLAHSLEHISFYATNISNEDVTICCIGPWFRQICGDEAQCTVPANAVDDNFYSADIDIFSSYGSWFSCLVTNTPFSDCSGGPRSGCNGTGSFTLSKGDSSVNFTISTDSMRVDLDNGSDTSTAQAKLGDDNTKPRRDRDTWSIQGTEGENITLTLEADEASGHSGEQATLILRNGGSTVETSTDALPIEITTTLPSDGEYQLVVQQNGIPEDVRFRG